MILVAAIGHWFPVELHGTPTGYWKHRRYHTPPCRECITAHAASKAAQRAAAKERAERITGRPVSHREAARILREARHAGD